MDSSSRFTEVATIAVAAALVAIGYRSDRAYRRWLAEISPLAGPRARVGDMKYTYRRRREELAVVVIIILRVLHLIDRAISDGIAKARRTDADRALVSSAGSGMHRSAGNHATFEEATHDER